MPTELVQIWIHYKFTNVYLEFVCLFFEALIFKFSGLAVIWILILAHASCSTDRFSAPVDASYVPTEFLYSSWYLL